MRALQFTDNIPRYLLGKAAGRVRKSTLWSGASSTRLVDVDPPALPSAEWVRVATRYGGICGSDVSMVTLHGSPAVSPFMSFPCTIGHENVGVIAEVGEAAASSGGLRVRQRVVVNPLLPCAVRGGDPCEACRRGDPNLCQRFRDGALEPGMIVGTCASTGGSWGEQFVAHHSQIVPLPDAVSDESALLVEPFAVALHAVLRHRPSDADDVLVVGAGVIGLLTVAALRATGSRARVVITARHPMQREMAERLGADVVIQPQRGHRLYEQVVAVTGGEVLRPPIGKRVVRGGAPLVFECVGADRTIDDALRLTASGGTMVLVGVAGMPRGIDWTPVWLNEVKVHGTYCYADEEFRGERIDSFTLAVRLMAEGLDLSPLFTHRFALDDYAKALEAVTSKGSSGVLKAAFEFDPARLVPGATPATTSAPAG